MLVSPFSNPFPQSPFAKKEKPKAKPSQQDPTKRYLNYLAGRDGCGYYRRGFVENYINMTGHGDSATLTKMIGDKNFYMGVSTITLQRQAAGHQKEFIQYLKSIQQDCGFRLIYEVDDVVFREDIPDYNASKHGFDSDEVRQNCIDMINMVDEVSVTCKYMRELYMEKTDQKNVTVVPNFMPYSWIGYQYDYKKILSTFEKNKKKPRIVYAGSGAHFDMKNQNGQQDDFSHVIKFIVDNRHKYQFVFIGAYPPPLRKYVVSREIEFHPWKNLLEYPTFIASLNAQLFIAPLQDIPFNRSKSDIKFIEAAQLGIPCLCQDMVTYEGAPDFLKFKDAAELEDKIDQLLNWKNRSKYYKLVPELRKAGLERILELPQNVGCFLELLDTPYGDPKRNFLKKWN